MHYASLGAFMELVEGAQYKRKCVLLQLNMHSPKLAALAAGIASKLVPTKIEHMCGSCTRSSKSFEIKSVSHGRKCVAPWKDGKWRKDSSGNWSRIVGGTRIEWYASYIINRRGRDTVARGGSIDEYTYSFYIPLTDHGKVVLVPAALSYVTDTEKWPAINGATYGLYIGGRGSVYITDDGSRHDKKAALLERILTDTLSYLPKLTKENIDARVPYLFRTGRVRSRYVYGIEVSRKEADSLWMAYLRNIKKRPTSPLVSFNEYARVLAVCKAAIGSKLRKSNETTVETAMEGYSRGMCGVVERLVSFDDPIEFTKEVYSNRWSGSHIFEHTGIDLYPPKIDPWGDESEFHIKSSSYQIVRVARTLLENKISFRIYGLKNELDRLAGDLWVRVNRDGEQYCDESVEETFPHVEWDDLPGVKFRAKP